MSNFCQLLEILSPFAFNSPPFISRFANSARVPNNESKKTKKGTERREAQIEKYLHDILPHTSSAAKHNEPLIPGRRQLIDVKQRKAEASGEQAKSSCLVVVEDIYKVNFYCSKKKGSK
jgi:hypothetical protein